MRFKGTKCSLMAAKGLVRENLSYPRAFREKEIRYRKWSDSWLTQS
jgi:hypothetical protein